MMLSLSISQLKRQRLSMRLSRDRSEVRGTTSPIRDPVPMDIDTKVGSQSMGHGVNL